MMRPIHSNPLHAMLAPHAPSHGSAGVTEPLDPRGLGWSPLPTMPTRAAAPLPAWPVGSLSALDGFRLLKQDPRAVLIDVRTLPEWMFVGYPSLACLNKQVLRLSWRLYPDMCINPEFFSTLAFHVPDQDTPLLFICRSGVRSLDAACWMVERGYRQCFNIVDGFEGPPNISYHRGTLRGWKASSLPWEQN